jgi:hypothetical protein
MNSARLCSFKKILTLHPRYDHECRTSPPDAYILPEDSTSEIAADSAAAAAAVKAECQKRAAKLPTLKAALNPTPAFGGFEQSDASLPLASK